MFWDGYGASADSRCGEAAPAHDAEGDGAEEEEEGEEAGYYEAGARVDGEVGPEGSG